MTKVANIKIYPVIHPMILILYVGLCSLVAYLGRGRKFGFWGYLVASFLLSPLMGIVLVLASDKKKPAT